MRTGRPPSPDTIPRHRMNGLRRKYDLPRAGSLADYMTDDRARWLSRNVPEGMGVIEYLMTALLDDAIAEEPLEDAT